MFQILNVDFFFFILPAFNPITGEPYGPPQAKVIVIQTNCQIIIFRTTKIMNAYRYPQHLTLIDTILHLKFSR